MSKRVQKNIHLLSLLCVCTKKQRNAILTTITKDQLIAICECVDNVLAGNVKLNQKDFDKIKKQKSLFREIRKKSVPPNVKKEYLVQSGGALPALLIPAITLATSLIGSLIR